jgi:hypothetical protein
MLVVLFAVATWASFRNQEAVSGRKNLLLCGKNSGSMCYWTVAPTFGCQPDSHRIPMRIFNNEWSGGEGDRQ